MTADEIRGIAWWNSLDDSEREFWLVVSLSASAAGAWAYFCRVTADGSDEWADLERRA